MPKDIKLHKVKPRSFKEEMVAPDNQRRYPGFHIDDDHLPEVRDWQIGRFYKIVMLVKQVDASEKHGAGFEIHEIGGVATEKKGKNNPKRFSRVDNNDDEEY